ncbi:two-component regulator propeller domain-containing protein [Paucibacter soli]|uniref:two-component regulator propeller domain-containing protein n=1 Tax=Paucibacter soli TaxID=3133433 RepID=UPI0030A0BB1B
MHLIRSVLLWAALLLGLQLSGQAMARSWPAPELEPRFETVGAAAIPRGVVASMAQDRDGFLWIGTGDGLVRYDGYRFRKQERAGPDPASRNLGWIRAMLPARDGRLWLGTESDGLAELDPQQERVELHRMDGRRAPAGAKLPALPSIHALAQDPSGELWVGSLGGLYRFDPATGRFFIAQALAEPRISSLLVDRQGTLWVGSWSGLSRRRPGQDAFEPVLAGGPGGLRGRQVTALMQARDGRIWVGTQEGELALVDAESGQGSMLAHAGAGAISGLVQLPDGTVWVGHGTGVDRREPQYGAMLQRLRHDARKPLGLAGQEVTSLLLDQAGAVWVGGFGIGLQRHQPGNHSLWLRAADAEADSPLAEADLRSLLPLRDGSLLAATHAGPVAVLDERWAAVDVLPLRGATAMAQAPDGTIWLGRQGELCQLDEARRLRRCLPHAGGPTRRLSVTREGVLWAGTTDGAYRLAPAARDLQRVTDTQGQPLPGEIHAIAQGPDGAVWLGSMFGLFRAPHAHAELSAVPAEPGAELGNATVLGLLFDHQQRLWVDTAVSGLHRMSQWDGQRARFEPISARHGATGRPFGANLLEDTRGRIWSHMHVYDPAQDRLVELSAADGMALGTGWFFSYAKLADGRLLFGGSKGLQVVRAESFDSSSYAPPLRVTELRVNGEVTHAGPLARQGLTLGTGQRSFSLEFAALDYEAPERLRYAYQLQGFDPAWIQTGAEMRSASYSNLGPGKYLLRVRATNRSGVWSPHELAIELRVEPAWWQGWWFRGLALVLLLVLIWALVQWRTHRLRLTQQRLELKVSERTASLQALSRELEESSLTDPLTGLRNRRFLAQHIEPELAMVLRQYQTPAAQAELPCLVFFLIDLDHFKRVNDQHGHDAGDRVLQQMRARLQQVFRESDYIVRWGGEEFLVLARGTTREHAAELARRAWSAVGEQPFVLDNGALLTMSCSLGFACFPLAPELPAALDWNSTVKIADAALYMVKRGGRDGWLGAVSAQAASAQALREQAALPLPDWVATGGLHVAGSDPRAGKH